MIVNGSVPLPDIPDVLIVTLSPTLTPSLPTVTLDVVAAVPAVASAGCVFVTVMPSLPISTFVLGFVASVSFAMDVMPTKSFAKPISSLPSLFFLVRILFAAVVVVAGTVPSPTISNVVPNAFVIAEPSLPWNVNPFAMMSVAVLFKSLTFTAAYCVFASPAAVFKRSKNVGVVIG